MIAWGIETLVASTLLMVLVLLVRKPVARSFGPNIAYALWLLPVSRMLLPPLPESWREQTVAPVAAAGEAISVYFVEPLVFPQPVVAAGLPVSPSMDWLPLLGTAWAIGALGFLAYHLISHGRFCQRMLRRARSSAEVAGGRVRVIETDAADGPLAFGIFRKYVAFPRDFSERYDPQERDLALAHELGHHIRGDLIANWVALVVLAIHWFNPVAWRAFRAFRADQEMACDALVLAGRAPALRHAYGRAIVKSAHGGAVSAACHLHTINEVKGRLRMLTKNTRHSPARIAIGLAGTAALAVAGLGLTASGTHAAETIKTEVERVTGVELASLDASSAQDGPLAPEAPAAPDAPTPPDAPEAPAAPHSHSRVVKIIKSKDGKEERRVIVLNGDGPHVRVHGLEGLESLDELKDLKELKELRELHVAIPDIKSLKCGKDEKGKNEFVIDGKDGKKKTVIICTDRIEAHAAVAAEHAAKARTFAWAARADGMNSALMGLKHARRSIEREDDLSEAQRAKALAGIDEAIAELESEKGND